MTFGLTPQGFKIKRLADIKEEIEQRFKDSFGENIDLSPASPEGQIIAIAAEREALIWELAQKVYDSQYPDTSEGVSLDSVVSITGNARKSASFSRVTTGVARGDFGTIVPVGTVISVLGSPSSRFVVQTETVISIVDGATFKSPQMELLAEVTGPVLANAGTLTVIENPIAGLNSFTNELDAELGSNIETDPELKLRRNNELQIAGSATIEAILSELSARSLVDAVIVFQNNYSIADIDGRPPHSLDIVVLGDDEQDLADAIFLVVGGGIETIGTISKTVIDSQGFSHLIKFSRPTEIAIYLEYDLTVDPNTFPIDGLAQVEAAALAFGETLKVGQDVIVFGYKALIGIFSNILGILDVELRIGKTAGPTLNQNVIIAPREIAKFDSSRITGVVL